VAAIALGLVAVVAVARVVFDDDDGPARAEPGTPVARALATVTAADAPFAGFTATDVSVGGRCLRVVIADEEHERSQGLRSVTSLGPYDGMLFVNGEDTDTPYTMSGTRIPLRIVWYSARGEPVDATDMEPCPEGDAACPSYAARVRYRYALETPAGGSGSGALTACS
jgi:uncharacterized membrane protein (UPF0127 family)